MQQFAAAFPKEQHLGCRFHGELALLADFFRSWPRDFIQVYRPCMETAPPTTPAKAHGLPDSPKLRRAVEIFKEYDEAAKAWCIYCHWEFGSWISKRSRPIQLRIHWDHWVPHAYLQANPAHNFVRVPNLQLP
jgi:hypothetical protein